MISNLTLRFQGMLTPEMRCSVSEYGADIAVHIVWWDFTETVSIPRAELAMTDEEISFKHIRPKLALMYAMRESQRRAVVAAEHERIERANRRH